MTATTPDWLVKRGGAICQSTDSRSWIVLLDDKPLYRLVPIPVAGKYGCEVTQTVDGKRLDSGSAHPTPDEALHGGLEDLRRALGW